MTSAWPQLDELIRELGDVCALPNAEGEPSLSEATMAVTKATTALTHAARARGRTSSAALDRALRMVEEARAALQQARKAIVASAARRGTGPRGEGSGPSAAATVEGQAEATCSACGRAFVVRYRALKAGPCVVFPVACPVAKCDGVSPVEYPATTMEIKVEPSP